MQALNTPVEKMLANADANLARDLPMFLPKREEGEVCIVGGGPSLKHAIPALRMRQQRGAQIWALNGAHDFLLSHRLFPDAMVLLDARPENVQFLTQPFLACDYYIAAQCDPAVFDVMSSKKVVMWVGYAPGMDTVADGHPDKPIVIVGGGNTVGLKALNLAHLAGFRTIHLYGFDSCYAPGHHAYPQALNDGEETVNVTVAGHLFTCARWMARQAEDFKTDYRNITRAGGRIFVHGEGLIPLIADRLKEGTNV